MARMTKTGLAVKWMVERGTAGTRREALAAGIDNSVFYRAKERYEEMQKEGKLEKQRPQAARDIHDVLRAVIQELRDNHHCVYVHWEEGGALVTREVTERVSQLWGSAHKKEA